MAASATLTMMTVTIAAPQAVACVTMTLRNDATPAQPGARAEVGVVLASQNTADTYQVRPLVARRTCMACTCQFTAAAL